MRNPQQLTPAQCKVDWYRVLGLTRMSSSTAIASAYQSLRARNLTPEQLAIVDAAWRILSNEELRVEYDAWLDMGGMKWPKAKRDVLDRTVAGSFGSKRR
jgi:DnaJ-class molecular chaperone